MFHFCFVSVCFVHFCIVRFCFLAMLHSVVRHSLDTLLHDSKRKITSKKKTIFRNEDNLKNKDDLRNEDNLRNDPINGDMQHCRGYCILAKKMLMTPHLDSRSITDPTPEMLSAV